MTDRKILIFGNSGSGKSTLAKKLSEAEKITHLDLDELAWESADPPIRRDIADSEKEISKFIRLNDGWVIEGCYTDLLEMAEPFSAEIFFLDVPFEDCVENARSRPWEPHKYESKDAQDKNIEMLIGWIEQYAARDDGTSHKAHADFYKRYSRKKQLLNSNK